MTSERAALVRAYRPGDEVAIQQAFTEVFAKQRPLAEWRWKFEAPPRGSRIQLAFDHEGRLVCQYAAIALDVAWLGAPRLAGQVVDVLSRGRATLGRRGSPFLRTVETFLAARGTAGDLAFIYGFPGVRHQRIGELSGLYNPTVALERLSIELGAGRREPAARRGSLIQGFDATATARLWRRSARRYRSAVVRDERWFAWRYAARPGSDYLQVGVRRRGEPRAWGILAVEGALARWVDLVWDGEAGDDLVALAAEIESRAREGGARRLELWLTGDALARTLLLARGYAGEEDPERRLSVISFESGIPIERLVAELYLTLGDSDHV